jgi:DNA modification methylase
MTDSSFDIVQAGREKQFLKDDVIHSWYRFVLSYPDHLVTDMCERFGIGEGDIVLDPFCGTGTTLVECKKLGIDSIGIEANPACVFASRIKTTWDVDVTLLRSVSKKIIERVAPICEALKFSSQPLFASACNADYIKKELLEKSPEGQYFISSGMLERGWISEIPFYRSIAFLDEIKRFDVEDKIKEVLKFALVAILVESVGNIRFGPEVYISGRKSDVDVSALFRDKLFRIAADLKAVQECVPGGRSEVIEADARECGVALREHGIDHVDYVITSPPYPTEKDYTRQTRLELVFLGYVHDTKSLQRIKKQMMRSHSKGIYISDNDGRLVSDIPEIRVIADELRGKIVDKTYGFAKLYPRIIEEYFGGLYRHLKNLSCVLRRGGQCAYVVGDQRTYLQTYTPTGTILGLLAERKDVGLRVKDVIVWRVRKGTTGSGDEIKEEIVILRKP